MQYGISNLSLISMRNEPADQAEMVNQVMDKQKKKLAFHNYDDIEDMIRDYCNEKGGE